MTNLAVFAFDSQDVRFVDGLPVANDVAIALGYAAPAKTISTKVDPENKGITEMVTPGGTQSVTVLYEPGIYQLIFSSKLDSAKRFQQWVFTEVLPTIRKTGGYSMTGITYPPAQPAPQRDTIQYIEAATALNSMPDSMLKLLLRDSLVDELELRRNQKTLPAPKKQYTIVKVRAKELGYTLAQIGNGAGLGRFVRKRVDPVADDRVGLYKVYHYEVNDALDNAIHEYFHGK